MNKFSTPFSRKINKLLRIKKKNSLTVLDLFAGCGGLALGFEANGFKTIGYEKDKDCCESYKNNLETECYNVFLDKSIKLEKADIIIGGPPCQPFSVGGKQKGILDARDGFPVFLEAISQIKPKILLFENVRGLIYKNKFYLEKITNFLKKLGYKIEIELMNASNYGVPQNRERIIVVGHKKKFEFPKKLEKKVTAYEALGNFFNYKPKNGKYLNSNMDKYIKKYEIASKCINPRDLYKDKPSRTLTCRNLAGATGDMLRILLSNGKRRRLLVEEAARLQSFPDWYKFYGNDTSIFNQIGNSVPPLLSFYISKSILKSLDY